jgi:hypothetical protein
MFRGMRFLVDAAPEAEWEVWYEDTFDRETPRQVETSGEGLAAGLVELWDRHLFETVQREGGRGFSRFNLWWKQEARSIQVVGNWDGMVKLRGWVFGNARRPGRGKLLGGRGRALLMSLGAAHSCLAVGGQTSQVILDEALASEDRSDFEARLSDLAERALSDVPPDPTRE